MAEPYDTRGARRRALDAFAALSSASTTPPSRPLTLNDLPNDVLVSVFMAAGDLFWVRHTVPCVCKAWNELYCSKDASPLHETLEVDFYGEVKKAVVVSATREEEEEEEKEKETNFWRVWRRLPHRPVVHASRVISWAERRAGSVHKLHLKTAYGGVYAKPRDDFRAEDLAALVSVVGSSLTGILIGSGHSELSQKPFWEALRDSVAPAGRLRSLVVEGMAFLPTESEVQPLAGSLEELVMRFCWWYCGPPRCPEFIFSLTGLRRLVLAGCPYIAAIPAEISSLKNLKDLKIRSGLPSLPKELGELSGLTKLDLTLYRGLGGNRPQDEAFPAELGKMKSLRELNLCFGGLRTVPAFVGELESLEVLNLSSRRLRTVPAFVGELEALEVLDLSGCGLSTVPAFVGELESLEVLNLSENDKLQIDAPLDFLVEGCPRLREVKLRKGGEDDPWTPESLAHLEAFKEKLLARNPNAVVSYE